MCWDGAGRCSNKMRPPKNGKLAHEKSGREIEREREGDGRTDGRTDEQILCREVGLGLLPGGLSFGVVIRSVCYNVG